MTRRLRSTSPRPGRTRVAAAVVLVLATVGCGTGGPLGARTGSASASASVSSGAGVDGYDDRDAGGRYEGDGYDGDRVGQFVARCGFSHRSTADPLVHPHGGHGDGPGSSATASPVATPHSHDFFGNARTDERTTAASLAASSATSCNLTDDRSAYWAPTLLDRNQPVAPITAVAYYDTADGVDASSVRPLPPGLAMIAGNDPSSPGRAGWACGKSRRVSTEVPTCPPYSPLALRVTFPDCWNGRDVTSPDHRTHVAYRTDAGCPSRHPVAIVRLVFEVRYPFSGDPKGLTLASGPMHTAHADVMNAWTERGLREQVELCIHRRVICGVA